MMSGVSLLPMAPSARSSEMSVSFGGDLHPVGSDGLEFRMLTLNCWGLKYVSKVRQPRMRFIANELSVSDADIVALQECWVASDYEYLRQQTHKRYPYAKYFYSGILAGSGLVILSRFPIESVSMTPYTINGRPSAFFRGDWYVGKGIASAIIRHPSGIAIEVFNTHMHAPYGPGDASYVCHRTSQAWQIARQIRAAVERGHLAIAVGDFNSKPDSLTYALLTQRAGLQDSWTTMHGSSREHFLAASLTPEEQITTLGVTCDSLLNTWRADRDISEAKRLDYCFHAPHLSTVDSVNVTFIDKLPGLNVSASDHFGVSIALRILPSARSKLASGQEQVEEGARPPNLPLASYQSILDVIASYLPTARAQQYYRLLHFWVSIVLVVALHLGIFWVKNGWPAFLVVLGSTVIGVTGVIDGMLGFLFGQNELRALKEFEEEVRWEMKRMEELLSGTYEDVGSVGKPR
ncbi:Endonuclease/exonuclease/phosphatase [Lipomyces orientalis]|uniref:Endonuclease/exonuclease/phosphatase n=1 Tax=Lipomyces orientalis TaxID=1233043 RepID=A0ACC3TXF4_9ASCO